MFDEANTVERLVLSLVSRIGWNYLAPKSAERRQHDVFSEEQVAALIKLNPEMAAQPDRADEVLYRLRAIVLAVRTDGFVKANEGFSAWLRGERTMPFGENTPFSQGRCLP